MREQPAATLPRLQGGRCGRPSITVIDRVRANLQRSGGQTLPLRARAALRLDLGIVGGLEHAERVAPVVREDRDPDAAADMVKAGGRVRDRHLDLAPEVGGAAAAGLGRHDAELVAPEPGDSVLFADDVVDRVGHVAEQVVAGRVAEAVVDALEAIQIDRDHREAAALTRVTSDLVGDPLVEPAAVAETGERGAQRRPAQGIALALEAGGARGGEPRPPPPGPRGRGGGGGGRGGRGRRPPPPPGPPRARGPGEEGGRCAVRARGSRCHHCQDRPGDGAELGAGSGGQQERARDAGPEAARRGDCGDERDGRGDHSCTQHGRGVRPAGRRLLGGRAAPLTVAHADLVSWPDRMDPGASFGKSSVRAGLESQAVARNVETNRVRELISKLVAGGLSAAVILLWWPRFFPADNATTWLVRGVIWTLSFELLLHALAPVERALWDSRAGSRVRERASNAHSRSLRGRAMVASAALIVPLVLLTFAPAPTVKTSQAASVRHVTEVKRIVKVERKQVRVAKVVPVPVASPQRAPLSDRAAASERTPAAKPAAPRNAVDPNPAGTKNQGAATPDGAKPPQTSPEQTVSAPRVVRRAQSA